MENSEKLVSNRRQEKRADIREHPSIQEKPGGTFAVDFFRNQLLNEGYGETEITAAMFYRLQWLEQQVDTPEELRQSALTSRILEIQALRDRMRGILQGIRAALEQPELFKRLLEKGF